MLDYAALAVRVTALLTEYGRAVTVVVRDRTPASATQPYLGGGSSHTTHAVTAVFDEDSGRQTDKLMRPARRLAYVPDPGSSLLAAEELVDGSVRWAVTAVEEVRPGPTSLLYILTLGSTR